MPPTQQTSFNKKLPQWAIYLFEFLGIVLCVLVATSAYIIWFYMNDAGDPPRFNQPIVVEEEFEDWKIYRNEEYGFELTFPDNWEGYKVFDFKDVDGNSLIFCLPTSDKTYPDITCDGYNEYSGHASVFSIGISTDAQWSQWNQEFLPPILRKKDGIVFSWSKAQDHPVDLTQQYSEVNQILSTFKFISTSTAN